MDQGEVRVLTASSPAILSPWGFWPPSRVCRANVMFDGRSGRNFCRKVWEWPNYSLSDVKKTYHTTTYCQILLLGILLNEATDSKSACRILCESCRDAIQRLNASRRDTWRVASGIYCSARVVGHRDRVYHWVPPFGIRETVRQVQPSSYQLHNDKLT